MSSKAELYLIPTDICFFEEGDDWSVLCFKGIIVWWIGMGRFKRSGNQIELIQKPVWRLGRDKGRVGGGDK